MSKDPAKFRSILEEMYADLMESSYDQLEKNGFNWPEDLPLDEAEKKEFLVEMINFYKEREEFEKCDAIYKMQQSLV
jgi:hypothetical protein